MFVLLENHVDMLQVYVMHHQLLFHSMLLPPPPNTIRMITCQSQRRCSRTLQVSGAVRFVRYLCLVVFIRARMRPICRLGCQPSPSSQQVFCAVLCAAVSAPLVREMGQIVLNFPQSTARHSQRLVRGGA